MSKYILISFLIFFISTAQAKQNVCSITLNSSNEINLFKKKLNPQQFDFIELTEQGSGDDWLEQSCKANIRCDVLIISGHFAGDFFGKTGKYLSSEELEEASCSKTCTSILQQPKEVFLFGCNTLAGKDPDNRSPEAYREALRIHGIDSVSAERMVQSRYGELGTHFKGRMQRSFQGVDHLYGFDASAPAGNTVEPFLNKYFSKIPDYNSHLERIEAERLKQQIPKLNKELQNSMTGTAFQQCAGTKPTDPDYEKNKSICELYNKNMPIEQRLNKAHEMLSSNDYKEYIPSISSFLERYQKQIDNSATAREVRKNILNDQNLRSKLSQFKKDLSDNYASLADFTRFEKNLGIITPEQYQKEYNQIAISQLNKKNGIEAVCALEKNHHLKARVQLSDLPAGFLSKDDTARGMLCLESTDPQISRELISAIKSKKVTRSTTITSLGHLNDQSGEIKIYASQLTKSSQINDQLAGQYILLAQSTNEQEREKKALEMLDDEMMGMVVQDYTHRANWKNPRVMQKLYDKGL